ncbi:winged helix-turn-helix domain-containing protein [Cloacibacillus porcorum]|uniref:Transcriptional regulator n=1 Tax=Cloacibacillus porcorum TaxID=1197717 RepID=A0A1B2I881_9BACT|nr:winged helix-turn-helix domain-containing protein [Cloacibacillus porcorum]ANZ46175.1 transcriptional regulator [Cloacibacillus porcorum]MDD7648355.1 winged helix-turn-helix domain-containing protein [Cloacibacillus porcorum]MDY4092356.1 winged helix-turn-helix domain-containing protein [Cloacibacillus porcorum]
MKKNIHFISLDSILAEWLRDRLEQEPPQSAYAKGLLAGLRELLNDEASTLVLGVAGSRGNLSDTADDGIYAGELSIHPKSRKVLRQGREISLTPKEFDILYLLAQNRGEVFTKEQIYRAVWDGDFLLADSNIMAFIRKLRKKIEPNPDAPEYILTIWGIGYKFNDQL